MTGAPTTEAGSDRSNRAGHWLDHELGGRPIPPLVVFIGFGDGSVLDALDERSRDVRVLALEPDAACARAFLASSRWDRWRESGRVVYLADPDYAGADQAWRIFPAGVVAPTVIVHPEMALSEGVARAADRLKRILQGVAANAEARRRFAPRYLVNSIRNLPAIVAGSDVRCLTDAYRSVPAIVAGAGPSLDAAMRRLRDMPDPGVIIAADTALRPLLAGGIAPHLVPALDPGPLNARHLLSLPECRDTWLVSESALDRHATVAFESRTFWFRASDHHPWPWFNTLGIDADQLAVWGSVLTGAFQLAVLAGCDPIVIVGADLSFTGDRPYARGTTYEIDWACAVAAGQTLPEVWARNLRDTEPALDVNGAETPTTKSMLSIRDWIVAQAARSGRRVINASGAGILHGDGIELADLADVLSQRVSVPPPSTFARRFPNVRPSVVAAQARQVRATLASESSSELLDQWTAFSGGGFDAAAVGAALDEAAYTLETKRGRPSNETIVPWAQSDMSTLTSGLLSRLPETVGRAPVGLIGGRAGANANGREPLPEADRVARLVQAWDLFRRICDSVLSRGNDLELAADAGAIGYGGVGSVYAWPDSTRWAVVMFEALLGDAWISPSSSREPAFCSRHLLPGLDVVDRSQRPNASCASALLALEWLRCAGAASELCSALADSLRIDAARMASDGPGAVTHGAAIAVEYEPARAGKEAEPRFSFSGPALSLIQTGALTTGVVPDLSRRWTCDVAAALQLVHVDFPALTEALAASTATTRSPAIITPAPHSDLRLLPRVLSRSGSNDYWFVSYATPEGVVCVPQHQRESVLVDKDGRMRPHRTWPRAINQECFFGDGGVLAWGNGFATSPEPSAPYVMYRLREDDEVTIEELPFRPAFGRWWQRRMYWSSFTRADRWRGLVSWAPGEGMRVEHPDVTSWAMIPGDDALVIQPCEFVPPHGWRRGVQLTGWKLRPGQPLESTPLGPYGSVSSIDINNSWTATAYPDIDTIRLESNDGPAHMLTCPGPLGVAWAGGSLLVSTLPCELLLFEGLMDVLERAQA